MIRPVSHPASGAAFDLAEEQPASIINFLADLRGNLPHHEHGLICETAGGDQRVYVVRRPAGGYSVRHYPGHGHHGSHDIVPESDAHKRGKDYTSGELERLGLPSGQEVPTDNHTQHDVATLDAPRIIAAEFQAYNRLDGREYKRRTTLAVRATAFRGKHARPLPDGVLPVWVQAFGMPRDWRYPVPSIAAQDTRWDAMPQPGSVTAIGVRAIQAEHCRVGSRWPQCPRSGRNWCGSYHPLAVLRTGLRVGEVLAMTAAAQLVPIRYHNGAVYLVAPADATLCAELGGSGTWAPGPAGERPAARRLGPCMYRQHDPVPPPAPRRPVSPGTQASFATLAAMNAGARAEREWREAARVQHLEPCEACGDPVDRATIDGRAHVAACRLELLARWRQLRAVSIPAAPVHAPVRRGICQVCGAQARLYPRGWLCDQHQPSAVRH